MSDSTTNLDLLTSSQSSKEVTANALFDAASVSTLFGRRASTTTALTWGYYGGIVVIAGTPTVVPNGTIALTASQTNYIEYNPMTGALVVNTTNWSASSLGYARVYKVVAGVSTVTSYEDWRFQGIGAPIAQFPMQYVGTWNANTNTPTLAAGTGTKGYFYKVSVAGTQDLGNGATLFTANDAVVYNGATWDRLEGGLSSAEVVAALGFTPENSANKDVSGGYPGLDLFKLKLRNAANTFTSFLTNAATAARTWTMPDKDGTVAMVVNETFTAPASAATIADNINTLHLADAQFVKAQIAASVNSLAMGQAINMLAAASGSNGISVADNANLDMGTNNFSIGIIVAVPDWTPSANVILAQKTDGTNGWVLTLLTTGILQFTLNTTNYSSTIATGLVDGNFGMLFIHVVRESASAAGSVTFVVDGMSIGTASTISAGSPTTVNNASNLYVIGTSTTSSAGMVKTFLLYNYSVSAGGTSRLVYRNGVSNADKWGNQAAMNVSSFVNVNMETFDGASSTGFHAICTSNFKFCGSVDELNIVQGKRYAISFNAVLTSGQAPDWAIRNAISTGTLIVANTNIVPGYNYGEFVSDISQVSVIQIRAQAACEFTLSEIYFREIGATLALEPEGINFSGWFDSSSNGLNASYPATGFSQTREVIDNGKRLPATAVTGSATLTIAQLLTREIQDTHSSGATATYTLPTAALMDAAMPTFTIGKSFEWSLINLSGAAADTCTIAAGTGHTIVGDPVVYAQSGVHGSQGMFRTKKTAASTYVTSRIG